MATLMILILTQQIQNLMSNDAQMFLMFAPMAHSLWGSPLIILVCFVALGMLVKCAISPDLNRSQETSTISQTDLTRSQDI
mgnify:CR=1 FL=1